MDDIIKVLVKRTLLVCASILLIINSSSKVFANMSYPARDNSNFWLITFIVIIIGVFLAPKKLRTTIVGVLFGAAAVYFTIREIGIIENISWLVPSK